MCICIPRSSLGSEPELSSSSFSSSFSELGRSLHLKSIPSLPGAHSAARMETDLRTQFFIRLRSFLLAGLQEEKQQDKEISHLSNSLSSSPDSPLQSFSHMSSAPSLPPSLSLSNHVANLFGSERKLAFVMLKLARRRRRPSVPVRLSWAPAASFP